ncbi:MAG: HlyD family secretion protein [Planctomycetota bacterium]|jgi:HlyD family secretion protein
MKTFFIIAVVLVLSGAGVKGYLKDDTSLAQEFPESSMATAHRGTLKQVVTENGYLKAKNSKTISPAFRGGGKITWLIEEGEQVKDGDILAEFDKTEVERRIDDLENEIIQYVAELEAAQSGLAIQERDGEAGIEKAELQLELKKMELERYEEGDQPNERRKKVLAFEKATSEFTRAESQFEQVPELEREGFLTKIQVEEERIKLREKEINEENAKRELELYNVYTVTMDVMQKRANLRDAERELINAREKATITLKEKQARVTQKERQLTQTENQLEEKNEELDEHTLKTEHPGLVYYGDPDQWWSRREIKVGNDFWGGNTMFTLPDLREMQVLVQIHEADIIQVEMGMLATISVETNKGEVFTGKVTEIAKVATDQGRGREENSNKTFEVEISMDLTDTKLRAGVTSKVDIQIGEYEDLLQVPIHAVFPEAGSFLCFVFANGTIEERKIEIGRNNSHSVEVIKGLDEGDRVLLYDPRLEGSVLSSEGENESEDVDVASELAGVESGS